MVTTGFGVGSKVGCLSRCNLWSVSRNTVDNSRGTMVRGSITRSTRVRGSIAGGTRIRGTIAMGTRVGGGGGGGISMGTGVSTMVWCGCGSRGGGIVCGEVGGSSGSDFWGVVYGQGCRMRVWAWNPAVGVPGVLRAAAYYADSHQAEKCDLENVNAYVNKTVMYYKVEVKSGL